MAATVATPATILLTRSSGRADDLGSRLLRLGLSVRQLPLIQLEAQPLPAEALQHAPTLLIFVSPAAAEHGISQLPAGWRALPRYAVGRATAQALAQQGWSDTPSPVQENSEGLLALSGLQALAGQRVFIVRGDSGRDLLRETLQQRGAEVKYLEVYRKRAVDAELIRQLRQLAQTAANSPAPLLAVLTSGEALARLCAIIPADIMKALTLVVASPRIAEMAAPRCDHVVTASGTDSDALFAAIQRALRQQQSRR
ncbi:uroporphyrinogen-III synthase [Permianibacter sp. IMCC34836]|uniref:uroporphyrinogen-III synthase n=1 Tax=Permianibacter fluminis TaxID=2738515 RepID=UPI001554A8A0|nr:uroporphyrinogen-III synthase [Permianibacter fluminis]NQD36121.1 uroporphyrinogen-III synthase [Permianibacter fluminis]